MTDKTNNQIAQTLKKIRLQKDLTQAELAEKAGINTNYYAKIERGELKSSIETLEKLVKALGIRWRDILPD